MKTLFIALALLSSVSSFAATYCGIVTANYKNLNLFDGNQNPDISELYGAEPDAKKAILAETNCVCLNARLVTRHDVPTLVPIAGTRTQVRYSSDAVACANLEAEISAIERNSEE